ncbi:elongation factor 1 gamma [Xylogone sp. PMI_703]|nr:elongation factor 1 gamma [Xylogone sp. PMI_703]
MYFGKLYGFEGNSRSTVLRVIAKENNLNLEFIEVRPPDVDTEYLRLNPLGRVPTFVRSDGFVVTEVMAIAIHFAQQAKDTYLLGSDNDDYVSIIRWMSFTNTEVLPRLGGWFRPFIGKDPFNWDRINESKRSALAALVILEQHLQSRSYLVGDGLTLADFFAASMMSRGFMYVLDKSWRVKHPNTTQWYEEVTGHDSWKAIMPVTVMIEDSLEQGQRT